MFQLNKNLATLYQAASARPTYANSGITIMTY
jgi:hypothetical protein